MTGSDAILIRATGGSGALEQAQVELAPLQPNEVLVRNLACGVNFIDIYQRRGLYELPLPAVMGNEAAGVIEQVGSEVAGFSAGERVAYCTAGHGCYCAKRNVDQARLIKLPGELAPATAAAVMLKGLTAEYLARRCWPVLSGDAVLVTAAAGGVGTLLCQWLAALGASVIGAVGSDGKREHALAHGCKDVIVGYADLAAQARRVAAGGVAAVYDSVGKDTWQQSLQCLAPRGCLISYGNASGPVPAIAPLQLAAGGSLYLTRPTLQHYAATAQELRAAAGAFFDQIARGLRLPPVVKFKFSEAARAHELLQSRAAGGALVLIPPGAAEPA